MRRKCAELRICTWPDPAGRSSWVRRCRWSGRGRRGDENSALKSEAAAANTYAYLVKGCSGGLVLDTIEQAFQATR
jgi:hypothetical protein